MIELENVTKTIRARGQPPRDLLASVTLRIASNRRVALLGSLLDDRFAVIDMLAGMVLPTYGRIVRKCTVSFPVGFLGGFSAELSVRLNVARTAKLYEVDPRTLVSFVEQHLGPDVPYDKPFAELPNPMKRQLGLIMSFAIPFDVYLMKGDLSRLRANPNDTFRTTSYQLFEARARTSGMIIAVSTPAFAREYCDMALVLHGGQLIAFDDVEEGIVALERLRYDESLAISAR